MYFTNSINDLAKKTKDNLNKYCKIKRKNDNKLSKLYHIATKDYFEGIDLLNLLAMNEIKHFLEYSSIPFQNDSSKSQIRITNDFWITFESGLDTQANSEFKPCLIINDFTLTSDYHLGKFIIDLSSENWIEKLRFTLSKLNWNKFLNK